MDVAKIHFLNLKAGLYIFLQANH